MIASNQTEHNAENEKTTQKVQETSRWLNGSDGDRLLSGKLHFVVLLISTTRSDDNAATTIPS